MAIQLTTEPGTHPDFHPEQFAATERAVLRQLEKRWYLTNPGRDIPIGKAVYRYILMKPIPKYQNAFGLGREIILLFSPYESFEPRALDALDKAARQISSTRLDSVCRVLVSRDRAICEKIASLSAQEPEQPTVVPFTYDDLMRDDGGVVEYNRFRQFAYARDLFSVQGPLQKDTFFFGRAKLVQTLVDRFSNRENSGLFGLRKSGKTSVIYSLLRWAAGRDEKVLSLDCESPSVHGLRWYELLEKVAHAYKDAKSSVVKLAPLGTYTEKTAADQFSADILKVFASKKAGATLLVFDEIERISPVTGSSDHWADGEDFVYFWQSIRSLIQQHPGVISFAIVGTNPTVVERPKVGRHDNPIFALVPPTYVPCFSYEQTCEMIEVLGSYMGLKFDPAVITRIQTDFGGHPFLTRQVCSRVHQDVGGDRPARVDLSIYDAVYKEFLKSGAPYLAMVLDVLREQYPDEHELLLMLAQGRRDEYESLSSVFLVNHLEGYGLVERQARGAVITVNAVKEFLLAEHKYRLDIATDEGRRAEINARSNALEIRLRALVRRALRMSYSESKAMEIALSAVPTNRREKLVGTSFRDLLGDSSPLFLLELKALLEKLWDENFRHVFPVEKQRFLAYIDDINETRRIPAHAKPIDKDDFAGWRATIKKIEQWLDAVD